MSRSLTGYPHKVHAHDHFQICYMHAGTCLHRVKGKQAALVKGDFFIIPPYLEHQLIQIDSKEFTLFQIDFMPYLINEKMRNLCQMDKCLDFAYIQPFLTIEDNLIPKMNFSSSNQQLVEGIIHAMQLEYIERQEGYRLHIKSDLLKLLAIVGREINDNLSGHFNKMFKTITLVTPREYRLRELSSASSFDKPTAPETSE